MTTPRRAGVGLSEAGPRALYYELEQRLELLIIERDALRAAGDKLAETVLANQGKTGEAILARAGACGLWRDERAHYVKRWEVPPSN